MNQRVIFSILIGLMCMLGDICPQASAKGDKKKTADSSPEYNIEEPVSIVLPGYEPWIVTTINGKLKLKGLPISPSIRIFMQKDALIEISVKVPFMGEVGRITVTPDSVTGVNKMNKTYTTANIRDFLRFYPGGMADVQNLILGRIVMPGLGLLSEETAPYVDIYNTQAGLAIVPNAEYAIDGFEYGYITDLAFIPQTLLVIPDNGTDAEAVVDYSYNKSGYDIDVRYRENTRVMEIEMELKNPEMKGEALKPIALNKNFRWLELGEFMKSFGK